MICIYSKKNIEIHWISQATVFQRLPSCSSEAGPHIRSPPPPSLVIALTGKEIGSVGCNHSQIWTMELWSIYIYFSTIHWVIWVIYGYIWGKCWWNVGIHLPAPTSHLGSESLRAGLRWGTWSSLSWCRNGMWIMDIMDIMDMNNQHMIDSITWYIYIYIYLSIYLSTYLSIYPSIYLSWILNDIGIFEQFKSWM